MKTAIIILLFSQLFIIDKQIEAKTSAISPILKEIEDAQTLIGAAETDEIVEKKLYSERVLQEIEDLKEKRDILMNKINIYQGLPEGRLFSIAKEGQSWHK